MHDLDRTQNMFESDYREMGYESDHELEFLGEAYGGGQYQGETVFNEVDEMELAANLLEINNEYELDHFLGSLIKKAGGFMKSGLGKSLGGLLKGAAKMALPMVGNLVAPGIGGVVGAKVGDMFGLELEGLSLEDQEFEAARGFVRFAGEAAKNAAEAPPNAPPQQAAKTAVVDAAAKLAPGLLSAPSGPTNGQAGAGRGAQVRDHRRPRSGRWVRQGRQITVIGV
jgi:hypothetical protein